MASILVCGGDLAAQVVTCLFGSRHKVIALSLYADEAQRWDAAVKEAGHMSLHIQQFEGKPKVVSSTPDLITRDPAKVKDCDVVIFTMPSTFHEKYFRELAPHAQEGTIFAVMPARSGCDFLFRHVMGKRASKFGLAAFETLPWACRFNEWGKTATIQGTKETISAAIVPPEGKPKIEVHLKLQGLLGVEPMIMDCPNILSISLGNPGQVIHPGLTYGKWRSWDGKAVPEKPLFYNNVDSFTADVLNGISADIAAICKALKKLDRTYNTSQVKHIYAWYMENYAYSVGDPTDLKTAMLTNSAYEGLCHPMKPAEGGGYVPDFEFRYLSEDVPTGLCFTKGIAELLAVRTPAIDKVLLWCQEKLKRTYISPEGRMIVGPDLKLTRAPQAYGITTQRQLTDFLGLRRGCGCFALGEKISSSDKETLARHVQLVRDALASDDVGQIESAMKSLQGESSRVFSSLYQQDGDQASAGGGKAAAGDDDVIDAEFEEN